MQTGPIAATEPSPDRRPWYRLHASTWVLGTLVAFWLAVLNLSLETRYEYDAVLKNLGPTIVAGWPSHFWTLSFVSPPFVVDSIGLSYLPPVPWYSLDSNGLVWRNALLDVLVAAAIIAGVVTGFEKWRRRRPRLWRLSLADLLFGMLLLAAAFAWIGRGWRDSVANHSPELRAVSRVAEFERPTALWNRLHRMGLTVPRQVVFIEPTIDPGSSDEPPKLTDADLAKVAGFARLRCAYLPHHDSTSGPYPVVTITDAGLEQLGRIKSLEYLSLPDHPDITDVGLPQLARLKRLKFLNLRGTSVTPA